MRKNKMMRVASALLVAVLLSTCAISSTFAKYVTSDSSGDVARVAKWGVVLQIEGDLYATSYEKKQDNSQTTTTTTADSFSVISNHETNDVLDNVVAPGTASDDGFYISLTGQPEVATEITTTITTQNIYLNAGEYAVMVQLGQITEETYDACGTLYTVSDGKYTPATDWSGDDTYYTIEDHVKLTKAYYPVVYSLTGTKQTSKTDITSDSLKAVAKGILANAAEATDTTDATKTIYTKTDLMEANTDLATQLSWSGLNVSWIWAFEQADAQGDNQGDAEATAEGEGEEKLTKDMCNAADTILANLMAERIKDEDTTSVFAGEVVKLDDTDNSYSAPKVKDDYCLDTSFSINITVTQVD